MVYLLIGLGGIAGSLLRYFLSILTLNIWDGKFPYGTLFINVLGSFLLGWFSCKFANKKLPLHIKTAISTGVIGSFTTFSTFCLETVQLIESGTYLKALLYVLLSSLGGLFFVKLGKDIGAKRNMMVGRIE